MIEDIDKLVLHCTHPDSCWVVVAAMIAAIAHRVCASLTRFNFM